MALCPALRIKILLQYSMVLLLLFMVFQKPHLAPRMLFTEDRTTIKKKVMMVSNVSPELEDVDEAIAKANLEERQADATVTVNPTKEQQQQQATRKPAAMGLPPRRKKRVKTRQRQEAYEQHTEKQKQKQLEEQQRSEVLPPLDTLIGDMEEDITGNVQALLDFAIVGIGKCGTTALIQWLDSHPEINTIPREARHLAKNKPAAMVHQLYNMKARTLANNSNSTKGRLQGFKNPSDVRRPESMAYIRQYWPNTKLIISLRHPVHWFQSLYNYMLNEIGRKPKFLRHTSLIGGPHKNTAYTHTGKGEFHAILSLLGKTNMTTDAELDLLKGFLQEDEINNWPPPLPNPIFLLEMTQMSDPNLTRAAIFRKDLQNYLGLHQELPPVPHVRPGVDRQIPDSLKMDLCNGDPENEAIREELMRISKMASQWIRHFFLSSPDVVVSSREYFVEILETAWMQDPCQDADSTFHSDSAAVVEISAPTMPPNHTESNQAGETEPLLEQKPAKRGVGFVSPRKSHPAAFSAPKKSAAQQIN